MRRKHLLVGAALLAASILSSCGDQDGPKKIVPCGNGELDPGETCDPQIAPGEDGACLTLDQCPAAPDACTDVVIEGFPGRCNIECAFVSKECGLDDGCCPGGCSQDQDPDCVPGALCGNGDIDPGETCDGNCPNGCDDGDACTEDILSGDFSTCDATCSNRRITSCVDGDGCCPAGCDGADSDCGSGFCGDGNIDPGELCDGNCPSFCDDGDACTDDVLGGDPTTCDSTCTYVGVTRCSDSDGCCPAGCNGANDDDCPSVCGNGVVENGESCDGNCPSSCFDGDACTSDQMLGDPASCSALCPHDPVTSCIDGDGCCPATCSSANDTDCSFTCGDGVVEGSETCDGNCPGSCNDNDACTTDQRFGSASQCNVVCANNRITACIDADGCCAPGCDANNDSDCVTACGNGVVEAGETCDGNCPTTCDDGLACTTDIRTGTAAACNVQCSNTAITACIDADGCCPSSCTALNDDDCAATCGNNIVEPPETCDGNCPVACDDLDACTADALTGSSGQCNAECSFVPISMCVDGDGCCPSGCTFAVDDDCMCVPTTCASEGFGCGVIADDGCGGGGEMCGTCGANQDCLSNICEDNLGVGEPCLTAANCPVGSSTCITEAGTGWSNGYCTLGCTTDADCGAPNHCGTDGFCVRSCASDTECATPDYGCWDFDNDARTECAPVGSGAGAIGAPCDAYSGCAGGIGAVCLVEADGFKGGFCTQICSTDLDCPANAHCAGGGCVPDCTVSGDCRGNGYDCYDFDSDAESECFIFANGGGGVGDACVGLWDCGGGEWGDCATEADGWPAGYCTIYCAGGEGTCPNGTHCSTTQICLDNCQNPQQCRASYQCADPGTGTDACIP